jgi:hypothetical protein
MIVGVMPMALVVTVESIMRTVLILMIVQIVPILWAPRPYPLHV